MIKLSDTTLKYLQNMLSKDYEVCITLKENSNKELEIENIIKGRLHISSNGTQRRMCEWASTPLTRVILHTHPNVSKSYPSKEDYTKVYKDKYVDVIESSLIFTSMGIFQMVNMKYGQSFKNDKDEEDDLKIIIDILDKDEFYPIFKDWRNGLIKDQDLKNEYSKISDKLSHIQNRIKLFFYPF